MTEAPTYLLDANVFMQAARSYYAFDLAPAFWQALLEHAAAGRVRSIDRVKREILRGNDDLAAWAKDEFGPYFVCTDQDGVIEAYRKIMAWVQQQRQFSDAVKRTLPVGLMDGWLLVQRYIIM